MGTKSKIFILFLGVNCYCFYYIFFLFKIGHNLTDIEPEPVKISTKQRDHHLTGAEPVKNITRNSDPYLTSVKPVKRRFITQESAVTIQGTKREQPNVENNFQRILARQCPGMTYNGNFGDSWINITSFADGFMYSAYKEEQRVRIIAAVNGRPKSPLFCKIWYQDINGTSDVLIVPAEPSIIPESHGKMYTAAYFLCPIFDRTEPLAVSLGKNDNSSVCKESVLKVSNTKKEDAKRNFSICVSPLNSNYSRAYELIEWVELNRLLGSQFFTFYHYSFAKNIHHVLSYYSERGLAEVLPWNLPTSVQDPEKLHYYGQLAALNDCLHRNRDKTKYLAFIDLDEFIIPRQESDRTWSDMFNRFPDASAYMFRNTFFGTNWQQNSDNHSFKDIALQYGLTTLTKFQRGSAIYPDNWRSKVIVQPLKVDTVGIHNVWEYTEDGGTHSVQVEDGILHHYRFWNSTELGNGRIKDETILKFKDDLIQRVKVAWADLNHVNMGL